MNALRFFKNSLVPSGQFPRTILAGPLKGIRMDLDLRTQSQIYVGLFERELHSWLAYLCRGIRTSVDVGAAHGEYTLYALKRTSAEQVISFEPDERLVTKLMLNLRLNGLDKTARWQLYTKYLSDVEGSHSVGASTLADKVLPPCLIKMDIDGGEAAVLHAAKRLLSLPRTRWLIETHSHGLERECISILKSFRYSTTIVPNAWWRAVIPEQRGSEQNRWLVAIQEQSDLPSV